MARSEQQGERRKEVKMKTVLVCNQKGGSGKSTVADNIAWSLERTNTPYNFYDLDRQKGVIHLTHEVPDAEVAVVDSPGALQEQMGEWLAAADCIVIPTMTDKNDQGPLELMVDLVKTVKCPVIYVVCRWTRYTSSAWFKPWFESLVGDDAEVYYIPESEALKQSAGYCMSIVEYKPRDKAAVAMLDLCNAVRKAIGLPQEQAAPTRRFRFGKT